MHVHVVKLESDHITLPPGASKVFGQSDFGRKRRGAENVSKQHFALTHVRGVLLVESLSTVNFTKVVPAKAPATCYHLYEGQQAELYPGDKVFFHPLEESICITVCHSTAAPGPAPAGASQGAAVPGCPQQQRPQQQPGTHSSPHNSLGAALPGTAHSAGAAALGPPGGVHPEPTAGDSDKPFALRQERLRAEARQGAQQEHSTTAQQQHQTAGSQPGASSEEGLQRQQQRQPGRMEPGPTAQQAAEQDSASTQPLREEDGLPAHPCKRQRTCSAGAVDRRAMASDGQPGGLPAAPQAAAPAVPPVRATPALAVAAGDSQAANGPGPMEEEHAVLTPAVAAGVGGGAAGKEEAVPGGIAAGAADKTGAGAAAGAGDEAGAAAGAAEADAPAAAAAAVVAAMPTAAVGDAAADPSSQGEQEAQGDSAGPCLPAQQAGAGPGPSSTQAAHTGPVMLILVGVQGSGKSTFSMQLIGASSQRWERINQDSISKGKRGSKDQCLQAARSHLAAGRNVIIDRTNIDPSQRRDFVHLARQLRAEAHCLVLRLPVKVCMERAAGRQDHEGGLQGKSAFAAVNIMHSNYVKAGPPTEAEGLKSVLVCENDAEVLAALDAWKEYGSTHHDPLAAWRQLAPPRKAPLPEEPQAGAKGRSGGKGGRAAAAKPAGKSIASFFQKVPSAKEGKAPASGAGAAGAGGSGGRAQPDVGAGSGGGAGRPPSAGTGGAAAQAAPSQPAKKSGGQSKGTPQQQQRGQREQEGQEQAGTSTVRQPAASQLPSPQPGPAQPATAQAPSSQPAQAGQPGATQPNAFQVLLKAFAEKHTKSPATSQAAAARPAGAAAAARAGPAGAGGGGSLPRSAHAFAAFPAVMALVEVAKKPERHASDPAFHADDRCVRISDKYPKARFHALVVARELRLAGPLDLRREDLPLLDHMLAVGREWAERQAAPGAARLPFFFGFHSVPSMRQLHLHVISEDMDSEYLKNKKHWNSFQPPFFMHATDVRAALASPAGRLQYSLPEREQCLKDALRCHRCQAPAANLPKLKQHIGGCRRVAPGAVEHGTAA